MPRVSHFIDGNRAEGSVKENDIDVFNPATGEVSAQFRSPTRRSLTRPSR